MRHPHLLARRAQTDVTTPVQPVGAVLEAPLQEARALVELADEYEQFVADRIDAGGEIDDGAIERVDVQVARGGEIGIAHGADSVGDEERRIEPVIIYSNGP